MQLDDLKQILGPFPEKAVLASEVIERVECDGYVREKVMFSSESGERIPAFVLVPVGVGPFPAVYCHHQHASDWDVGKSEVAGLAGDSSQAIAVDLVLRGFIAFAPDALCFEERKTHDNGRVGNYRELSNRLCQGTTLLSKVLFDVQVGVDYLCSRSDVDSSLIGFIGHSYGGRMALWVPAVEKRFSASVSHCGCVSYAESIERNYGVQMEFCVPGIMSVGDVVDVLRLADPCNVLISATLDDKWSSGAKELYAGAKDAFVDGEIELALYPGGHEFSDEMKDVAYSFLENHLQ